MSQKHDLNMFASVAFSAVYPNSAGIDPASCQPLVYGVLKTIILKHSALALHLHGQSTDNHVFHLADKVDLAKNVVWLDAMTPEAELRVLIQYMDQRFANVEEVPPWRLLVCPRDNTLSVHYLFHHALMDGTSGKWFMLEFGNALNSASPTTDTIVTIPSEMSIHPPLEDVLDMPQDPDHLKRYIEKELRPESEKILPWCGKPCVDTFSTPEKSRLLHTNMARYTIDAATMQKLTAECRRRGISITALISAISLVALDTAIPEHEKTYSYLKISLPRNLRPLIDGIGDTNMGAYIDGVDTEFQIGDLRGPDPIWACAVLESQAIKYDIAKKNQDLKTGMLKFIPSLRAYFTAMPGTSRGASIEFSSLVAEPADAPRGDWTMRDFHFAQSVSSTGWPVTWSVLGFRGGELNLTCTWPSEAVDMDLATRMIEAYAECVKTVADSIEN